MKTVLSMIVITTINAFGMGIFKPQEPEISKKHCTTFLDNNASWTSHVYFSDKVSTENKAEILNRLTGRKYTRIYLYAANEGDYGGRSVMYSHDKKDFWNSELKKMRKKGLGTVMWIRADDSGGLNKWSEQKWKDFLTVLVADLDSNIDEYVTCLECNEYWSHSMTTRLTAYLRGLTKKDVGVHTTGISAISYADGADKFYLQTGFGQSESTIASQVVKAVNANKNRPVILAEYSKTDDAKAHKLCLAGMANGADGCGNGCD